MDELGVISWTYSNCACVVLRTDRLTLRPIKQGDVHALFQVFTDPAVRRYLLDDQVVGLEWVEEEVDRSQAQFDELGCGLWAIRRVADTLIIGFAGFRGFFEPPELQLLYGLLPSYWGNGFATEAAKGVIEYAFEDLGWDRVVAATDIPNRASIRVMKRLGMEWNRKNKSVGREGTVWYSCGLRLRRPMAASAQPSPRHVSCKGTSRAAAQVRNPPGRYVKQLPA